MSVENELVSLFDELIGVNPEVSYFVYSRDFVKLWSHAVDDTAEPWKRDVFLVWDGVPEHAAGPDIGVRDYLTAYDWAVVMMLRAQAEDAGTEAGGFGFRLHLLELCSRDRYPGAYGVGLVPLLQEVILPWATLYADHQSRAFEDASLTPGTEGMTLAEFFGDRKPQAAKAAELVSKLWRAELTRAGLRHSVSNVVGPAIMAQALRDEGYSDAQGALLKWLDDPLRSAFWTLLEAVGLLPPLRKRPPGVKGRQALGGLTADPIIEADLFCRFKEIRFALVDDQASAGFHEVLAQFLLGAGQRKQERGNPANPFLPVMESASKDERLRLGSFTSPDVLLEWLERAGRERTERWYQPRVFGKAAEGTDEVNDLWQFDLLCLDLRLHGISGAPSQYNSEQNWLKKLLEFHRRHSKAIERRDSGLNEKQRMALRIAVKAAGERLNRGAGPVESSVAHVALLPILIAVCDPTVPIVLFSSTRQRAVLDLLRPFPNIDISFLKPSLTGYTDEDSSALNAAVETLRRAVRAGLRLHERRLLWELLYKFDLSKAVAPACILSDLRTKGERSLENGDESPVGQTLSFSAADKIHHRILFEMILECVLTGGNVEFLFRPHEFMESVLLAEKRKSSRYSTPTLNFWLSDITAVKDIEMSMRLRVEAAHKLVVARNQYAHGYFVGGDFDDDYLGAINIEVSLLLLFSIGDEEMQIKIGLIVENSNFSRLIFMKIATNPVTLSDFEVQLANTARRIWSFLPTRGELVQRARGRAIRALQEGDVIEGIVAELEDRYATIDIGNVSGNLHISEMAKQWVSHPSDILRIKQAVQVKIIAIDHRNQRISLSIKQL